MYTDWFKLKSLPFRLRPDPDFLYLAGDTAAVYAALRAATIGEQRLICLLGESGVGKTTLLHALARDCQGSASIARVQQPNLTSSELTATLAEQLGLALEDGHEGQSSLARLRHHLTQSARAPPAIILVDEAQRCSSAVLHDLLDMRGWESAPSVVLAGEEELARSLPGSASVGLAPSSVKILRLARLAQSQIGGYVEHRLRIAGSEGREVFEADTMTDIYRYTGGTPQLINTLCDAAMTFAEAHSTARVGIIEVRDAVRELNWIEFSARSELSAALADSAASAATRGAPLGLEVRHDQQLIAQLMLAPGCLLVGRAADSGLRLESRFVSRRHCQLVTTEEQTIIEDLGSANGVLVNGQRQRVHRLAPGDAIAVGDYTLICTRVQRD